MKSTVLVLTIAIALPLSLATFPASAKVTCDEVIATIEAKLANKRVTKYTLKAIPKSEATDLRVVGNCDAGAKKIIYKRG